MSVQNAVLLSGNVLFVPNLPDWKVRALNVSGTVVYDKVFLKFADNVTAFWDTTQWLFNVDSDPVIGGQINDTARSSSPAIQYAQQQGDNYTRGYYTVCSPRYCKRIYYIVQEFRQIR